MHEKEEVWTEVIKSLEEQMLLLSKRLNDEDPQDMLAIAQVLLILREITYHLLSRIIVFIPFPLLVYHSGENQKT